MVRLWSLSPREASRQQGAKQTIALSALNAGLVVQYQEDHARLHGINKVYGYMNFFHISNNSDYDIEIDLDYTEQKRYIVVTHSSLAVDEVMFNGFSIKNRGAGNIAASEVYVTVGNERPIQRERRI